jgi:hypothetical protein
VRGATASRTNPLPKQGFLAQLQVVAHFAFDQVTSRLSLPDSCSATAPHEEEDSRRQPTIQGKEADTNVSFEGLHPGPRERKYFAQQPKFEEPPKRNFLRV